MGKIPAEAKCVFRGEIFDVYQWPQRMYDGSIATFERLKRADTVVVLPTVGGKVLYAEQEQPDKAPYLSLFGGRLEDGEDKLEGAKRELLEETGLVSDDWELLVTDSFRGKIDWQVHYFVARDCRKVAGQNLDGGEKITVLEADFGDFVKNVVSDPRFYEPELQKMVYSAFNSAAAKDFENKIFKGK